jgi:hypothetical protein
MVWSFNVATDSVYFWVWAATGLDEEESPHTASEVLRSTEERSADGV